MDDIAVIAVLFENENRGFPVIHETDAAVHPMAEIIKQRAKTAWEAPLDSLCRNIAPAMGNPFGNPQPRHFDTGQRQIDQLHPPASGAQTLDQPQITAPGQCCLKGEVLAGGNALLNFAKKDAAPTI